MTGEINIEAAFVLKTGSRGRRQLSPPIATDPVGDASERRVQRVARLMALAIRFYRLLAEGKVRDYAEIARLGHVSRARATQIMNLLNLAPDIQEELLFLPPVEAGRDRIKEWQLRPIAAIPDWHKQRKSWAILRASLPEN